MGIAAKDGSENIGQKSSILLSLIVSHMGVGTIVVQDVMPRDAFTEVGLEAVDTHAHEPNQVILIPFGRLGVRDCNGTQFRFRIIP